MLLIALFDMFLSALFIILASYFLLFPRFLDNPIFFDRLTRTLDLLLG